MICSSCGHQLAGQEPQCEACGALMPADVSNAQEGATGHLGSRDQAIRRLRRHIPNAVAEGILRDPDRLKGERRQVTVLFADIVDFTHLSAALDAEPVFNLINNLMDRLVTCIHRYDGMVDKFTGDGLMAVFGAPVTHENDSELALRSALDMQEAVAAFAPISRAQLGQSLQLRIGIHAGPAIAGIVGNKDRAAYTVIGETVNVASRVESAALPGHILVSQSVFERTKRDFSLHSAGKISAKGIEEPVQVYQASDRQSEMVPLTVELEEDSALIGRDLEFNRGRALLAEFLHGGRGQILLVSGEAGIGKSRLITAWLEIAANNRATIIRTSGLPYARSVGYSMFRSMLQQRMHVQQDGPSWDAMASPALRPFLRQVAGLPLTDQENSSIQYLDPERVNQLTSLALREWLLAEANRQPVILVLEDLHWADALSREVLKSLTPLVGQAPVFICASLRPSADEPASHLLNFAASSDRSNSFSSLELGPLSADASRSMLGTLVNLDGMPSQLVDKILSQADGNPFYIKEFVRTLIEKGVLSLVEGQWQAVSTAALRKLDVPTSLHGLMMARVDQLSQDLQHILRSAAVIGSQFAAPLLVEMERILGGPSRVEQLLERLVDLGLLVKQTAFVHSSADTILIVDDEESTRETLGDFLSIYNYNLTYAKSGSEALARAVELEPDLILLDVMMPGMDGLEVCRRLRSTTQFADVPVIMVTALDDRDSRLQAIEAGADDFITKPLDSVALRARVKTIMRLRREQKLAQDSSRAASNTEIRFAFRHAITQDTLYTNLLRSQRPELHRLVGECIEHLYSDHLEEYIEDLARHYYHAWEREKALHFAVLAGNASRERFANREAMEHYSRALQLAHHLSGSELQFWQASVGLGEVQQHVGEYDQAIASYHAALDRGVAASPQAKAQVMLQIAQVSIIRGSLQEAEEWLKQATAHLGRTGVFHPEVRAEILSELGWVYLRQGDLAQAAEQLKGAQEMAQMTTNFETLSSVYNRLGALHYNLGDWQTAASFVEQALELRLRMGDMVGHARSMNNLGILRQSGGDWDGALAAYQQAAELHERIGEPEGLALASTNLGVLFTDRGDWEEAEQNLLRSLAIVEKIDHPFELAQAHLNLAHLYLRQDKWIECDRHLSIAIPLYDDAGTKAGLSVSDAHWLLGQLNLNRGHLENAVTAAARCRKLLQEATGEENGDSVEWGRYEQLMGRLAHAQGDPRMASLYFNRSLVIFRTAGSELESGRTIYWHALMMLEMLETEKAVKLLNAAARQFTDLGAKADLRNVDRRLAELGSSA